MAIGRGEGDGGDGLVRVCLLGPIEIRNESGSSPVAGTKLQSLLAMLGLAAPHAVSDDRLLEGLWGDEQPGNPANALQALVSHLRRLLGRDAVERRGFGYALALDPESIDAVRLDRLVRQGRAAAADGDPGAAAACFRAALSLCRGTPLGDVEDRWFAREATARLTELSLDAQEGLAESELAMGRHAEMVGSLTDLVVAHPVRERLRAHLIVALYRCGRQADALSAYADARRYLVDELGLDPSPELQALERAVLAHDPALASPVALAPTVSASSGVPTPLTSFVGRQEELALLHSAISESRMTTVLGPAGVGKTRLVVQYGQRFAVGRELWFTELAPVLDPAAVPEAIADVLGASATTRGPRRDAIDRCVERIGSRAALVIIDNCEHVAAAAALAAHRLLRGCPNVRIVATSREPLGVDGEHEINVGPLDLASSCQLFVDRARSVQPHFGSRDDEELAALCARLDGLPLAIELAAARAKTLPLPEIAARLHDRFQLLRRVQRLGAARHVGLGAAIDWSHDLLFEDERRAFRRLAVFTGGATIEAAEALCGPEAFDLASRLVDRSLLVADLSSDEVRFSMLESLRDYAWARLEEAGEVDDARRDHLAWCTALAERVDKEARRADQLVWLARLDREHDNVRSALAYAVDHEPATALQLIGALFLPWWFRGRRAELRQWSSACLATAPATPSLALARVLANVRFTAEPRRPITLPGELESASEIAERRQRRAVAMSAELGDDHVTAYCQFLLLATMMTRRASAGKPFDSEEFARLAASAYDVFVRFENHYGAGCTRVTEALAALLVGDIGAATVATETARTHAEASGERYLTSRVEYLLCVMADLADEPRVAYRHAERSLRLLDELGIHEAVTAQARLLPALAERGGEPELAAQWRRFVADRNGSWSHFDGTVVAAAQNRDGLAARKSGDLNRAVAAHTSALEWYEAADLTAGVAFSASCLGFIDAARGDPAMAARHHRRALHAAIRSGDADSLTLALEGIAGALDLSEEAGWVLGAARRRRELASGGAAASHREDVAAIADALRASLGDAAFEDAIAKGASAAIEDIIAIASGASTTV